MDVSLNIRIFADAVAEVASIENERIKTINVLRKGFDTAKKLRNDLLERDRYNQILKWLFLDELCKGYYTL